MTKRRQFFQAVLLLCAVLPMIGCAAAMGTAGRTAAGTATKGALSRSFVPISIGASIVSIDAGSLLAVSTKLTNGQQLSQGTTMWVNSLDNQSPTRIRVESPSHFSITSNFNPLSPMYILSRVNAIVSPQDHRIIWYLDAFNNPFAVTRVVNDTHSEHYWWENGRTTLVARSIIVGDGERVVHLGPSGELLGETHTNSKIQRVPPPSTASVQR
jgi:hypothetical protein